MAKVNVTQRYFDTCRCIADMMTHSEPIAPVWTRRLGIYRMHMRRYYGDKTPMVCMKISAIAAKRAVQ